MPKKAAAVVHAIYAVLKWDNNPTTGNGIHALVAVALAGLAFSA